MLDLFSLNDAVYHPTICPALGGIDVLYIFLFLLLIHIRPLS
jgi:hypothetical protein